MTRNLYGLGFALFMFIGLYKLLMTAFMRADILNMKERVPWNLYILY